jgi:hypothetical protein
MAYHDRYGLPLSTSSEAAAAAYREGVDLMFSAWPGAGEALDTAIAADPDFALAHIARARHHFIYADVKAAQAKVAKARELVARNGTAREKGHVETLALGMEGQSAKSLSLALAHLDEWPRDAMIMILPRGFFLSRSAGRIPRTAMSRTAARSPGAASRAGARTATPCTRWRTRCSRTGRATMPSS